VRSHVGDELYSLDDYRRRYAQYRLDPDLQAAHASAAFVVSYDDHEVDNNWGADRDQDGTPAEAFLVRRSVAMQAWYEHMPVRRAQLPIGGALTMYRRLDFGDLLRMHVLDTRQYRSDLSVRGPGTILGSQQESWLSDGLSNSACWNLLAQQVMVMPFVYPRSRPTGRTNIDAWSGYPAARARLVEEIRERKLTNVVIATGDVHQNHAGTVPVRDEELDGPAAATEFVCTSISSNGDGMELATGWKDVPADNPHCQLFNARRGYQTFEIRRSHWRTDVWTLDQVTTPTGKLSRRASFIVERGEVSLHQEG
jgi:alkaline phosphatase D